MIESSKVVMNSTLFSQVSITDSISMRVWSMGHCSATTTSEVSGRMSVVAHEYVDASCTSAFRR